MSNHTPGPWRHFILDKPLNQIPAYVETCIAASIGPDFFFVLGEREDGPVDVCHVGNGPRGEANARLIAAAPDLLEALQEMVEIAESQGHIVKRARAAIEKATVPSHEIVLSRIHPRKMQHMPALEELADS